MPNHRFPRQRCQGPMTSSTTSAPLSSEGTTFSSSSPNTSNNGNLKDGKRQSWRKLIFSRDKLHVQRIIFSLPRFHVLGFLWAVIELAIFIVTAAQTDFEALDTVTLMLKTRLTQQIFLNENAQSILRDLDQDTIVSMVYGSLGPSSQFCGPPAGSPYSIYINAHAYYTIKTARADVMAQQRDFNMAEEKEESERRFADNSSTRFGLDHSQEALSRYVLRQLLCNRTEPLIDQRYIMSNVGQSCSGAELLLDISRDLDICENTADYNVQLIVAGTRNVCIFYFHGWDPVVAPEPEWTTTCIHFGTKELKRTELRWIFRRLEVLWDRFRAAAMAWILLSVFMRLLYWYRVVEVTRRSLVHLRTECPQTNQWSHSLERKLGLSEADSRRYPVKATASAHVVTMRRSERAMTENLNNRMKNSVRNVSLPELRTFLTASSIGIACANNDSWYLSLSILRQILGGPYVEMLLASAVTTPTAAWQAFGIVIYHEAIIQGIFWSLCRIFHREPRSMEGVIDVGVLGYVSMLYLSISVQSSQLFNVDILGLFRVTNWLISSIWWIILPGCGPDGPCLWSRGDIVIHTVTAIYISGFAVLTQTVVSAWRKSRRRKAKAVHHSSLSGQALELRSWREEERHFFASRMRPPPPSSWLYLGTVGCPSCWWQLVKQPTVIPALATDLRDKKKLAVDVEPTCAEKQSVKQHHITRSSALASTNAAAANESSSSSKGCCLWYACDHSERNLDDTATSPNNNKQPTKLSSYRFMRLSRRSN